MIWIGAKPKNETRSNGVKLLQERPQIEPQALHSLLRLFVRGIDVHQTDA